MAASASSRSTRPRHDVAGVELPRTEPETITLPGGVVWRLLRDGSQPSVAESATVIEVGLPPGTAATRTATTHARRDQVVVLEGALHITLAFTAQVLAAGEAVRIDGSIPHRFENKSLAETRFLICVFGGWDGIV